MNRRILLLLLISSTLAYTALHAQSSAANKENPLSEAYFRALGYLEVPKAQAPFVPFGDNRVLFTFDPTLGSNQVRYEKNPEPAAKIVMVAFEHEQFTVLHQLSRNTSSGVFMYLFDFDKSLRLKLTASGKDLVYRFVVDGVWIADPRNPDRIVKSTGTTLSRFRLANLPPLPLESPELMERLNGMQKVVLRYKGKPGQEIFVGASFNAFDPYLHILHESFDTPGLYEIELRLRPGQYLYYFVIDGMRTLDPLNNIKGYNNEGKAFSRFVVEKT